MDPRVIVIGLMVFVFIVAVLMLVIFPAMFWFFIIPPIENRLGQKLKFGKSYDFFWPVGKYMMGYVEVAFTISLMYLSWKILGSKDRIKFSRERALIEAGYDVEAASRYELMASVFCFTVIVSSWISVLLMFLIPQMYP